jgi:TPR repeat protein
MAEERGFVFDSSDGEMELSLEEVKKLAAENDPDGLYALGMAYLFGWDIDRDTIRTIAEHMRTHRGYGHTCSRSYRRQYRQVLPYGIRGQRALHMLSAF